MVTCAGCAFFLREFSICTSYGIILPVDPAAGCIAHAEEASQRSPCKQLTPNQFMRLKDTDFKMTWDKDGWLTDVGVRGLPRVQPLSPIPHEAITFSYYDQRETGRLTYSRNPGNPGILVFSPLMHPGETTVYKQWNADQFPPGAESKRIPAFIVPSHLKWAYDIAHQINYRIQGKLTTTEKTNRESVSGDIVPVPPDLERICRLWRAVGYTVGTIHLPDSSNTTYFAYRNREFQAVVFIETDGLRDVNIHDLAMQIEVPVSEEDKPLERFGLATHCILCGLSYVFSFDVAARCNFCLRRGSQIVFKSKATKDIS